MAKEIPGFYFDEEKNRYFPLKGPIPGSSSSSRRPKKPVQETVEGASLTPKTDVKIFKLLQCREMYGNVMPFNKRKFNFQEEMAKAQASRSVVMKYEGTARIGDSALQQITIDVNRIDGRAKADILLAGGVDGSLSLSEVGKAGQDNHSVISMPKSVWPRSMKNPAAVTYMPMPLRMPAGAILHMPSTVSCIKPFRRDSDGQVYDRPGNLKALITTLGSDLCGGHVYMLDLSEPFEFEPDISILTRRLTGVSAFNCTVWTADCCSSGRQVVTGTNMGASLVDMETGTQSCICRSKSDVLATQVDQSGNVVICGLRNGTVVTIDVREKWKTFTVKSVSNNTKRSKLSGLIDFSRIVFLPSSISCLLSLQSYDQYFLASAMDGSIKLYDHRLTQKGAVQSYEGHVNSHTRIELGVDPYERFVMSGGEDCSLRLWSIKSGKLIFQEKFSDSVISRICWRRSEKCIRVWDANQSHREYLHSGWEAWLGSREGLFYVNWLQPSSD